MRKQYFPFFLIFALACNNASNNRTMATADTAIIDTTENTLDNSGQHYILIELNKKVLSSIKKKDYRSLASYTHPSLGLRLSPYATVDINNDVIIKSTELLKMMKEDKKLYWGNYDGTGDPINLSTAEYFAQFVYDVDFLNAEKVTLNQSRSSGNSVNNIATAYPKSDYIENYFSGFNKEYEGMDWRALRLVFQKENNHYYLVGIVHDQWTI